MDRTADTVRAFMPYPEVPVEQAAGGPLGGLTFAVKDIYDVAGYRTGCGNATALAEAEPAQAHAACVAAVLAAGARFVGKTHTVEFAYGMDGVNEHFGTPLNPAAPDRVPGGSSSGSAAAVAAGLVDFAFGSDTGGSVRVPASFCGLLGLRTTFGRIDISGTMPLSPSLDTVGWFARTGDIYAKVGEVLLGPDMDGPPLTRLLLAEDAFSVAEQRAVEVLLPGAVARVEAVLGQAGALEMAGGEHLHAWASVFRAVQAFEAWRQHGGWVEAHPGALTGAGEARFGFAREITASDYEQALGAKAAITARLEELLGDDGVIVLPAAPDIAPRLDAPLDEREAFRVAALQITSPASLSGLPQISLPLAEVDGVPVGLSLIGPRGRDRALIDLARKIMGD